MDPYHLDALRPRRAVREFERRRRVIAALALLLVLAAAAIVPAISIRASPRHRRVASLAVALGLARRRARSGTAPTQTSAPTPAPTPAQIAAAGELAALGRPLYCGGRQKPMVALTFDDGPGVYTRLAVKKLREYHLRATFFLVGKEIRAWPHLVGLEKPFAAFGDHTMTHPFLPALAQAQMVQEMRGAKALIERTTGEQVVLFRPPYEGRTPAIDREARALGLVEVLWNVDSQDSVGADYAGIERNVIHGLRPGSIILMHENHGQTIRALPEIFAALRRDHLEAVTVPQLIAQDSPSLGQLRSGRAGCAVVARAGSGS